MKYQKIFLNILIFISGILMTEASDEKITISPLSSFMPKIESITNIPLFQSNLPLPSEYWGISQKEVDFLFENSTDYIAISGVDRFKKVNKVLQRASGWSEEELISSPHETFQQPDNVQEVKEFVEFATTRLSTFGFEAKSKRKDGSIIWIQWLTLAKLGTPLEAIEDRLFFCIGLDITQKKEQEASIINDIENKQKAIENINFSLQKQNKILRSISEIQYSYIDKENLPQENDGFSSHCRQLEGILQHFIQLSESEYGFIGEIFYDKDQPFVQQVFGVRNQELINKETKHFLNIYKQKGRRLCNFDNIVGEIITTKKPIIINNFETYPTATGIPPNHPFSMGSFLGIPFVIQDELVGMVALANRDKGYSDELLLWLEPLSFSAGHIMNEFKMENWRKEAESQKMAREEADAANEAKSSFLAHMSHEIRTPLTGILGLLDLIQEENLPEEDLNYLKTARISGISLMRMLNNILDISKIESHQIELEKVEVDPIKIAQELIQFYSSEAKKKETILTLTLSPDIPYHLIGDSVRLRQIISNLISNAVKFTKKGSVSVTLKRQESPEKDSFYLSGAVTDTGIGMEPETAQKLFQPFMQADKSIMRQFGGSGLGLYITKSLCEVMGGGIKAISQIGAGSTFQFTVKMELPKKSSFSTSMDLSEKSGELKKFSNLHILIAEDELVSRLVLKTILNQEGCSMTAVKNGFEAVEAIKRESYDLILMNGEMPVMGGLEATRRIRQIHNHQTIPIIGVTAHDLDQRERFLDSGMDGYLTKPVGKNTLKDEIIRCLKERKSEPETLEKLHILIAEDNTVNQLVLKTMLNREGCSTTVVENGLEAVKAIERESYDLILMDGEMPVMDGLEATRRIRQMRNHQTIPIIGVTAHVLDTHREQFLASGMDGYLTKPVEKNKLKAEIIRCLKYKKPHNARMGNIQS